jgi:hypothetical protein
MDHQAAVEDQSSAHDTARIGNMACKRGIPITIHEWQRIAATNLQDYMHAWEAWCALH